MTYHSSHTKRLTFSALAAIALAMVFTTTTHAVTYKDTGTFDDGGTWIMTAVFPETALDDDWNVTAAEMSSWDVSLSGGTSANHPSIVLNRSDLEGSNLSSGPGISFSGTPSSPTFLHYFHPNNGNLAVEWSRLLGPGSRRTFRIGAIGIVPTADTVSGVGSFVRNDPASRRFGAPVNHTPPPPPPPPGAGVPEPLTATLGLMGLGMLGMATRRRAA